MNSLDLFFGAYPLLIKGAVMTIQVMVGSAFLSFTLGLIFGVCSSNQINQPILAKIIKSITFVLRAVPFYVQLLIVYFLLPDLVGVNLEPFPASILALGACSSGYVAQTVQVGINTIAKDQWETAFSLGYTKFQTLIYVIFPQMFRSVLPALNNEVEALLKSTSVVSSIGLLEITRAGMNLVSREMQPVPIYLMVAGSYIVISIVLKMFTQLLERRLQYAKA
jgi:His/Glu/Gln/Arg/opine family amino acid ABC transporter permease subunit